MTDESGDSVDESRPDEEEFAEPGQVEHFHEDQYVHGVAQGLKEKYDISDRVYSFLVYGMETPVTEDGEVAEDNSESVAVLAIMPPMLPGGMPMPMEVPMLDDETPYTIETDAEDLEEMDIVAYYDEDQEATVTGTVVEIDEEDEMASLMVGGGDDAELVSVHTGGDLNSPEINGVDLSGGFKMSNDDEEETKDWWRVEEFEEVIEGSAKGSEAEEE